MSDMGKSAARHNRKAKSQAKAASFLAIIGRLEIKADLSLNIFVVRAFVLVFVGSENFFN